MKSRFVLVLFIVLLLAAILPISAQENPDQSAYYYVNVPIEKIYPYRKGYVVVYRKGTLGRSRAYIPLEWFNGTEAKGEVILMGPGSKWPSLTVFYKEGAFDHLRLYLRQERNHETWGNIDPGVNIDGNFEDVDDFKLEF